MLRVGLTGGIGSGKSTVTALLRELGAVVTDADLLAREVVAVGAPALTAIVERFGPSMLLPDGGLDRAALARIVFPDPAALRDLEAITGPAIASRAAALRARVPPERVDVYDMPLLVEHGLWVQEHLCVVVWASEASRLSRLVGKRGIPEADARARIARQATDEQRHAAADAWIDNDGAPEATAATVRALWRERLVPYHRNLRSGRRARRPETLTLVAGQPEWANRGARVSARVAAALAGRGVVVAHIGSTAVPGLLAKDVVDLQVGVRRLADADEPGFEAALNAAGYLRTVANVQDHPHPAGADPTGWAKRYYGGQDPGCVVHLHVREIGSPGYLFALAFRDWLRAEPGARADYTAHKLHLAERYAATSDYAQAKEAWFAEAYPRVMAWARDHHPG